MACLARRFAREARPGDDDFARVAAWTGLLHDFGKYSPEFQAYLRGEKNGGTDTHHAVFGARRAFEQDLCGPAFAVAGHHAGLHDRGDLQSFVENPRYAIPSRLPQIRNDFEREIAPFPAGLKDPQFAANELSLEFYVRMLFSCLVDADFLETERFHTGKARRVSRLEDLAELLLERLVAERESKPRDREVNAVRNRIFDRCIEAARGAPGFYSLTVPTGGGKTLSAMAFALSHAKAHGLRRVLCVIPYLSIIEQNADEYHRVLDPKSEGYVIEHHSAVPVPEDHERGRRSAVEIASENWDAPVIVTTSVQFIESLFARTTSQCRKVHNIARSVVILDEVQTLPVGLLAPILSVFRELTLNYGVSFVFSTATQPAFRQNASLPQGFTPGEITEIAGESPIEVRDTFRRLDRVRYERADGLDWKTLAERIASAPQALCVVNLRKHAFALWEALRDAVPRADRDAVLHLSSAMCAQHRLDVLGEIKSPREGSVRHRLKVGLPCWLVSTQVVEAGVDIDFPVVFRALGPLDSIVQAAGRCNREGRLAAPGRLIVFTPAEPAVPPGIYKTATAHTASLLARIPLESLQSDPELFGNYFSGLFQLAATDHARRGESTIQEDRAQLRFKEVARKAKVIEDDGRPVVVPFACGTERIQSIRARPAPMGRPRFGRHDLRALQRYMVNVRERDLQRLGAAGAIHPILPNLDVFVLDEACYHRFLGVLVDQHPTEDLCGV